VKRPPPRIQLLGAGLAIVTVGWTFDMLTGPVPVAASAAPGEKPAVLRVPMPADPPDRARLEAFLSRGGGPPQPLQADTDLREPFAPTARFKSSASEGSTLGSASPDVGGRDDQPAANEAFVATHKLQAILMGRDPLAMINDRLHRCGAEVDGYRIDRIARDRVTLSGPRGRVVLVMPAPTVRPRDSKSADGS